MTSLTVDCSNIDEVLPMNIHLLDKFLPVTATVQQVHAVIQFCQPKATQIQCHVYTNILVR